MFAHRTDVRAKNGPPIGKGSDGVNRGAGRPPRGLRPGTDEAQRAGRRRNERVDGPDAGADGVPHRGVPAGAARHRRSRVGTAPQPVSEAVAFIDRTLALARDLRAAGVDTSLVEVLDAVRALGQVDVGDRTMVHLALGATLVKRPEDRAVFEALFERHFSAGVSPRPAAPPVAIADDDMPA